MSLALHLKCVWYTGSKRTSVVNRRMSASVNTLPASHLWEARICSARARPAARSATASSYAACDAANPAR